MYRSLIILLIFSGFIYGQKSLDLTAPNGGERWQIGSTQTITWNSSSITQVGIQLSTDNGNTWQTVSTAVNASLNQFSWDISTVNFDPSSQSLIRVYDLSDATFADTSNATFTLSELTILEPLASTKWKVNSSVDVLWSASSDITFVTIEYSIDGGTNWTNIASNQTASAGTYTWWVQNTPTSQAVFRIKDSNAPTVVVTTSDIFTIADINLTSPSGGQDWFSGTDQVISWTSTNITNVKLEYSNDNGSSWITIENSISAGAGNYTWTVPNDPSDEALVRVSDASASNVSDQSDTKFVISSVEVTSPNGANGWEIGSEQTITWTSNLTGNVKIELSTDGGNSYGTTIISSINASTGSYDYTVPNLPSNQGIIKISNLADPNEFDISDDNFTIGALTLTAPVGGETWQNNNQYTVSWTNTSGIDFINIEYSLDGTNYTTFATNIASSDGSSVFTIPGNASSANAKIRISDAETGTGISDVSNVFTISRFLFISPVSSTAWENGSTQTIQWTASNLNNIDLAYTTNSGTSWVDITSSYDASLGSFNWTIPSGISTTELFLRQRDSNRPTTNVAYSNQFKAGRVTVDTPGGGDKILGGSSYDISWTSSSSISNLQIQYSSNGGTSFSTVSGGGSVDATTPPFSWTVPNVSSTNSRIKIADADGLTINDTSAVFSIATLQVTAPISGGLPAGGSTAITWTNSSNIANVNIEFTLDGTNWTSIANNVSAALGTFNWDIPSGISSSNAQVRISDVTDTEIAATGAAFRIGTVVLDKPEGTDILTANSTYNIEWTATSSVSDVKLEYSTNDGVSYTTISGGSLVEASLGSFNWTIPNLFTTTAKIRISDANASTISDESETFTISTLRISFPSGGEAISTGENIDITWTQSANVSRINLEYSLDSTNYVSIASNIDATLGTFNWTIPGGLSSSGAVIRISDFDNPAVRQLSNSFKFGTVSVSIPDGTEKVFGGGIFRIEWFSSSSISNVRLEYSTDDGANFNNITGGTSVPASQGFFDWTVPSVSTNNARIRISDAAGDQINDTSAAFSIYTLEVTSPNGGEGLRTDIGTNITWNSQNISDIKIEYSTNNGSNWNIINSSVDASLGTFAWTPTISSSQFLIRLSDASNAAYFDVSDSVFKVADIKIVSPNGGETFQANSNQTITWSRSSNITLINLDLSTDNGGSWVNIVSQADATQDSYNFTVSDVATNQALIRISDDGSANITDNSDAAFTIKKLKVVSPNGGSTYLAGSNTNITWSNAGVDTVLIEYTTNSGLSWNTISTVPATPSSFTWNIPNAPTNELLVRVSDNSTAPSEIVDISDNSSVIKSIVITSPNGGESFEVRTNQTITWDSHPDLNTLRLEYSVNSGNWQLISTGVSADAGTYNWTIPNVISSNVRVRAIDEDNTTAIDTTDGTFSVGSLSLASPQGNARLQAGESFNIAWTTISSISNVKLEYSIDNGATYTEIVASVTASDESYTWSVPTTPTSQGKIKISDVDAPSVFSETQVPFTIAQIAIQSPNGGEVVKVNDSYQIGWSVANISNIEIDYSLNNGTSWNSIADNYDATLGVIDWTANSTSQTALIRIMDSSDSTIVDQSDLTFKILRLDITSPIGGEEWMVGNQNQITWNSSGISNVKIEYSSNSGTSWNSIIASTNAATGAYNWTLPSISSQTVLVRLSDVDNPTIQDSSDAEFLVGDIDITSPLTGAFLQSGSLTDIEWTASSSIGNVKIEYRENETAAWQTIVSSYNASLGTIEWRIPGALSTTEARIKLTHTLNGSEIADSTGLFTVNSLQLLSPNSGEFLQAGTTESITWSSSNVANLRIEYATDVVNPSWNIIVNSYPAGGGSYSWNVPSNLSADSALIRITDVANTDIQAQSDGAFQIGWIKVNSPTLTDVWQSSTQKNITWNTSNSVQNVRIEYSLDNGSNWNVISSSVSAALGSYTWTIPSSLSSSTGLIRISDASSNFEITDNSDNFSLVFINLTQPNGSQNWQEGSTHNINWAASDLVTNLDIDYSTNAGSTWNSIDTDVLANSGVYSWTLPSPLTSTQALIRLTDSDNATVSDQSDAVFTISSLSLTSPLGGEKWKAGGTESITWSSSNITNVKLEYSDDNGLSWNSIVNRLSASLGTYDWTIPSIASNQTKIRITSAADATIADSSNVFSVSSIAILSPNGGEEFQAGAQTSITWSSSIISTVNLFYSTDNGANWNTIVNNFAAAGGSYDWMIPSGISSASAKVKIEDTANNSVTDSSDAVFTIGNLVLTSPSGGDHLQASKSATITWNSENISNIKIEYSLDNGTSWNNIASSVAAALGTYEWSIDAVSSNQALVRLSSTTNATISDQSSVFKISLLSLTSPAGAEVWQSGSTKNITWTSSQISNVKLEYSTNSGSTWNSIINSTGAASGSYSWTLPSASSVNSLVRISDVSNPSILDSSSSVFTIGSMSITSPNGGEKWQSGSEKTITWSSANIGNITLQYSSDNGSNWNTISTNVSSSLGSFNWTIPDFSSNQVSVRLFSESDQSLTDNSDALFTVSKLSLTSPNGGENWQSGSTKAITWESGQVSNVSLSYSTNNGSSWNSIVNNVAANTGSYSWTLPSLSTSNAKIRIIDVSDNSIRDSSSAVFVIGSLSLTSPAGGEKWQSESSKSITWTSSNIVNVKIEYSIDNGSNWSTVINTIDASLGKYDWILPDVFSTQAKVRISSVNDSTLNDESPILTVSKLALNSPVGGEILQAGSVKAITWSSGAISNVAIDYSTNQGGTWNQISTSVSAALGTLNWTVPSSATSNALVRIHDVSDASIKDSSSTTFTIAAISLTSPSGGEVYQSGDTEVISWTSSNVTSLKIDFSSDNGSTWQNIISSVSANLGSYSWEIDDFSSANTLVRISSTVDTSFNDVSPIFTVKKLDLTSPNGAELLQTGATKSITWTSGQVNNINISYSVDGGVIWNQIAANYLASNNSYLWTVPSINSTNALIKIVDATNNAIADSSASAFTIGSLSVTSPAGGEVWQSGSTEDITWSSINMNSVKIEYSTNNGANWSEIIGSVSASLGKYSWTIPDFASNISKIRISSVTSPTVKSESNLFTVGKLSLTSPNGGENWEALSSHAITWSSNDISNIDLAYSLDNGQNWTTIVANLSAALGTYTWNIPDTASATTLVRISDSNNSTVRDSSTGTFSISRITFTNPISGSKFRTGTERNITWNAENLSSLKLEYSTNNGTSWNVIINSVTASSGSYTWSIPGDAGSTQARIRASSINDATISETSDLFTITELTLTSPDGAEKYQSESTQSITWSSTNITNLNLFYSDDNGTSWNQIAVNVQASTGSYNWAIPAGVGSTQMLVKLVDANDNTVEDVSNNAFTVANLVVNSPLSGTKLQSGTDATITWTSENTGNLKIEYSLDNGSSWTTIINSINETLGQYVWTLPDSIPSNQSQIRVSAVSDPSFFDVSDVFTVTYLGLTSPIGSERWQVGTQQNITWNSDFINQVNLYYSLDDGQNWNQIAGNVTATNSTYAWNIPSALAATSDARVKISDASQTSISDSSGASFTIGSLLLTSPIGGEKLQSGKDFDIEWSGNKTLDAIKIEYSLNGGGSWVSVQSGVTASVGKFTWTLPDTFSNTARVRITDIEKNNLVSSSADFTIARLAITSPTGGEYWQGGTVKNITWQSNQINNIKLELSVDDGASWSVLGNPSQSAANKSYSWNINSTLSSQNSLIRISDVDQISISDTINNPFVVGNIVVSNPNGGEIIQSGSTYGINWTNTASIENVKIEYSTDGGSSFGIVVNSTPADNSYDWNVPTNISTDQAILRITDAASSGGIVDTSDNRFTISSLMVTSPIGGESFKVGSNQNIEWTASTNITQIKLEYFTSNNGWQLISNNVAANLGTFNWTVPSDPSDSVEIRISNVANLSVSDQTDNKFRISDVSLTAPTGGEKWQVLKPREIRWTNTSNVDQVDLYYSVNGGSTWNLIESNLAAATGKYDWRLPDQTTSTGFIKIADSESSDEVIDTNVTAFVISRLLLTSPVAEASWVAGDTKIIKWNSSSDISAVALEYSVNSGATWNSINDSVNAASAQYSWNIPNSLPNGQIFIKVNDFDNSELADTTNVITIISPSLALVTPNGGEFIKAGANYNITWNSSSDITNLKLEYTTNSGSNWNVIENTIAASSGSYSWNVPPTLSSTNTKLRIRDAVNTFVLDTSSTSFKVGWVQLVTPNGGEHWQASSSQDIIWNHSSSVQNVRIEYSTNNGSSWTLLETSYPADSNKINWDISNISTSTGLVRISDANSSLAIDDISEANFTVSLIQLSLPNGGEEIKSGTDYLIKWTNSPDITNIDLLYSLDGGTSYQTLVSNIDASVGEYNWTLPTNISSAQALIRVRDFNSPLVRDASDAIFDIKRLSITTPIGGETWQVFTNQTITWTAGNVQKINIEYSTNNGSNWVKVADSITASIGSYNWNVPNSVTEAARLRLSDISNSNIAAVSDSFTIFNPSISITSPTGGEHWKAGSNHKITWTSALVNSVKIEFSADSGSTWQLLTSSFPADSSYNWAISDNIETDQALIKVTDVANEHIVDSSSTIFAISKINLTSPIAGEYWNSGRVKKITWQSSPAITGVRIQYSTDAGQNWLTISGANNVNGATGQFNWDIPDFLSTSVGRIRVMSSADTSLQDVINGDLFLGWVKMTDPNGGEVIQEGKNYTLKWTNSNIVSSVRFDLIDGRNNQIIETFSDTSTQSGGSSVYQFPSNLLTDSVIIRVSDLSSDLNIVDSSDAFFTVASLNVVAPALDDTWEAGKQQTIQWSHSSEVNTIDIEFSRNNGSTWEVIASNVNADDVTFNWTPSIDIFSDNCLIRLKDVTNANITNASDRFNIFKPFVDLSYPNGGERLLAGTVDTLRWTSSFASVLRLELSTDGGNTWADTLSTTVSAADSSYIWSIPPGLASNTLRFKLTDISNANVRDVSLSNFAVGSLALTSPNGGENWQAGKSNSISWTNSSNVDVVNIYYTTEQNPVDSNWILLGTNVTADAQIYNWNINENVNSTTASVKIVESVQNSKIESVSDNIFTISRLNLVAPNGGEFWAGGSPQTIKWISSDNVNSVHIDFSTDNGQTYSRLFSSVSAALGEISWNVPSSLFSDSIFVKIYDANNVNIADESDNKFSIGSINIVTFTSNEKILEGELKRLEWEYTTNIKRVDIHYRLADGVWRQVILNYPADSSYYNWVVPFTPSDSNYIRIRNSANFAFSDTSDAPFTIARLNLSTPNGGQVWKTGNINDIQWESEFISNVELHYTTDTTPVPSNWVAITRSAWPADSTTYHWSVTDELSKASPNYRVRIRDIDFPSIQKISDNNFTMSYIKVLQPNGINGQQIGTEYDIKWLASSSTIKNVNIYVQTAISDENWEPIERFLKADTTGYTWDIQSNATNTARIKVEDADNPATIFDVSDSVFTISQITLTFPKGGEFQKLQIGKTYDITWESDFIEGVEIEYSIDSGNTWNLLENYEPAASGRYSWTVENTPTREALVRISDFNFSNVHDISSSPFTLSRIELVQPNERTAYRVNSQTKIKWSVENIDSIRIQISTDNGVTWPILESIQSASVGEYDWTVPSVVSSTAKVRITDFYDLSINDASDTSFVIGDYPSIQVVRDIQSDTLLFIYEFNTPGETLSISGFDYQVSQQGATFNGLSSLVGNYSNIAGPVTDTIKWSTKGITTLSKFEGPVNVDFRFLSNFDVTYPVALDSVGLDNRAPIFDENSIVFEQQPYLKGWNSVSSEWSAASDTSKPIRYSISYSRDNVFDEPVVSAFRDSLVYTNLRTSTNYNVKLVVSDALGNEQSYLKTFKTRAAADFVGTTTENVINAADLAAFVQSWSIPDSISGADMYPYTDSIPTISVVGDNKLELNDLLVFVDMWNYFQVSGLPKSSTIFAQKDLERRELDIRNSESVFEIPMDFVSENDLVALSLQINYPQATMKFDSLFFGSNLKSSNDLALIYNDSTGGRVTVDFASFEGKLDKKYKFSALVNSSFDRNSQSDSLVLQIVGYNSNLQESYKKSITYVLNQIPNTYELYQNYPNPFNPTTVIQYDLPENTKVELIVYDILGQQVAKLLDTEQKSGRYEVKFDSKSIRGGLSSGVYLYRLSTKNYTLTKKMILLK